MPGVAPSQAADALRDLSLDRRELLKAAAVLGGTMALSGVTLASCTPARPLASATLSPDERQLLEDVADTILPTTPSSPGAKAAKVGAVMALLLEECRDPKDMAAMRTGLAAITRLSKEKASSFNALSPSQREQLLLGFDAESKRVGDEHWYHVMRQVAEQAYFSTEIGMTKALRYVRVPGHFTGCLPLEPNQPAWG
ncbi:MAG: gluconate 2-dehydrogenase subunit 3 family protein [Gemmatimonadaceae bacterium]